jgi:hypothetical protein
MRPLLEDPHDTDLKYSFRAHPIAHFSENWGYLQLAPMAAGNIFMIFFGRNLDAHEAQSHSQKLAARAIDRALKKTRTDLSSSSSVATALMRKAAELVPSGETPQCLDGKECYVAALHLTSVMTFGCVLLSIWVAWRDRRRLAIGSDGVGAKRRSLSISRRRRNRVSVEQL